MKKYIDYYYGMKIDSFLTIDDGFYFKWNNAYYLLKICTNKNIEKYYDILKNQLLEYKLFGEIIYNLNGKIITEINKENYVLLKLNKIENRLLTINDIKTNLFVNNMQVYQLINYPWNELWQVKIDYFEKYFEEKNNDFGKNYWIYQYVIGMGELALKYFNEAIKEVNNTDPDVLSIQHQRVNVQTKVYDYYDPTSLIIDHTSRDIAEYIKSENIETLKFESFKEILKKNNPSKRWVEIFYSRLLFPSILFDEIESVIDNNENKKNERLQLEKKIINNIKVINKIGEFLKKIYGIQVINLKIK